MPSHDTDNERLDLLTTTPTAAVAIRVVVLAPGCTLMYVESEWRDAVVEIERGEVEVELRSDDARRFRTGDVLWLVSLPIRALHNRGRESAVLVAASRRWTDRPLPADCRDERDDFSGERRLNRYDDNQHTPDRDRD